MWLIPGDFEAASTIKSSLFVDLVVPTTISAVSSALTTATCSTSVVIFLFLNWRSGREKGAGEILSMLSTWSMMGLGCTHS